MYVKFGKIARKPEYAREGSLAPHLFIGIPDMVDSVKTHPIFLPDEATTDKLGALIAAALSGCRESIGRDGLNIRLDGTLGAGKTTLTRAVLRALGVSGRVRSPTFTLVETYSPSGMTIHHFDFYRFESPEEFEDAGFRDLFGPGKVTMCEWSEKAGEYLPPPDVTISLSVRGLSREAELTANSPAGNNIATKVAYEWN